MIRSLILLTTLTSAMPPQSAQLTPDVRVSVSTARERYAAADYDGALDVLDHLAIANPPTADRQWIDLYRILCFVALGKQKEADEAIAALIARDPLYRPDAELPPRLRSIFTEKRKLQLPSIIQNAYVRAKSAFDRNDYKAAAEGFSTVLVALADPDMAAAAGQSPLSDIRVLARGFSDLAAKAMAPQPSPPRDAIAEPAETHSATSPRLPRIYDSHDADVTAPVTIRQDIPRFSRPLLTERTVVLFIVIDESGGVESAIITESFDRAYDTLLLAAAKTWTYQPAQRNGQTVKYRKRIQVTLTRQSN